MFHTCFTHDVIWKLLYSSAVMVQRVIPGFQTWASLAILYWINWNIDRVFMQSLSLNLWGMMELYTWRPRLLLIPLLLVLYVASALLHNGSTTGTVHRTGHIVQAGGHANDSRTKTAPVIRSDGHGKTTRTIYETSISKQTRITQGNKTIDVINQTYGGRSYQYFIITTFQR